jgi:flagellar hook-length control protein FliK
MTAENNGLLKDEDVLSLAKTFTAQQVENARQITSGKQGDLGAENKSGVISLLKEMDGKVKFSSEKNPAKTDTGKLITADSFLADRTSVKETLDGKIKATLESTITSKQEAVTLNASLASTAARFLDQRQLITRKVATENSVITPEDQPGQAVFSSSNGIDASEKIQTEVTKTGASFKDAQFLTQNSDRFQQALGERLMKMIESGKWNAEMELNPKRLGVVRISMALDNNEMQLAMSSNNSAVRDLLEGSLAKLRDGLNESGITLANAFVGQDSMQDESKGSFADKDENGDNRVAISSSDRVANQDEEKVVNVVKHNGDLDTFA